MKSAAPAQKNVADFSVTSIPSFVATGKRRCAAPGVGITIMGGPLGSTYCVADFWRVQDGAVLMRVSWLGCSWSFQAQTGSGQPIPNEHEPMEEFADFVAEELERWMVEDAADLPPFEDYETDSD